MNAPENDLQITIRMPTSLKTQIDAYTKTIGITSMEFIRRAIAEKLQRETNTPNNQTPQILSKETFRMMLIEILNEDEALREKCAAFSLANKKNCSIDLSTKIIKEEKNITYQDCFHSKGNQ